MNASTITVPQVIVGVLMTGLLGLMSAGFWKLWEVDSTQDSVLARLDNMDVRCSERVKDIASLHVEVDRMKDLIDIKASDRYTGKDAKSDQEKNDIQHTFMWSAINKLQDDMKAIHDELFRK